MLSMRGSLLLRILIAAIGVAYILLTFHIQDQVVVAAGTQLSDGRKLSEDTAFVVLSGEVNLTRASGPLEISIGSSGVGELGVPVTMTVTRPMLALEDGPFQLQTGIATMLQQARRDYVAYSLLLLGLVYPLSTYRWGLLLRARGMAASTLSRFRLVMVGAFFNFCMPGLTGGDLVRAYYVARGTDRRADAVMTVVMDRVAGLVALVLVAVVGGLFVDDAVVRRITLGIWLSLLALVLAATVYLTRGLRPVPSTWLSELPGGALWQSINSAAVAYGHHKSTLLIATLVSVPMHVSTIWALTLAGYALGMKISFGSMLAAVPLLLLGGALPLTYQGLGAMEWVGEQVLVEPPFVLFNQIVGMLLILRLCNVLYALLGSVFVVRGDIRLNPGNLPETPSGTTANAEDG